MKISFLQMLSDHRQKYKQVDVTAI